jgi:hypothetical protein
VRAPSFFLVGLGHPWLDCTVRPQVVGATLFDLTVYPKTNP